MLVESISAPTEDGAALAGVEQPCVVTADGPTVKMPLVVPIAKGTVVGEDDGDALVVVDNKLW